MYPVFNMLSTNTATAAAHTTVHLCKHVVSDICEIFSHCMDESVLSAKSVPAMKLCHAVYDSGLGRTAVVVAWMCTRRVDFHNRLNVEALK